VIDNLFTVQKTQIDLVIPGLFDLPLYEIDEAKLQQQTPALHRLLRFARRQNNTRFDIDDILIDILDLNQAALPYAHACKALDTGYGLLFKPVHLKADMNNALVFPVAESDENIKILINDLRDYFKVDFDVKALADNLFLMQLNTIQPTLEVPHYLSATGKKVTHYLDQAKSNLEWFKLFNEIQMFLFQHPVNQYRQQQGQPLINSLWCWGADSWQRETRDNRLWFSDDSEMQALGKLYCGDSDGLDEIPLDGLQAPATVVDLSIMRSLKGYSTQPLLQLLVDIEQRYLNTLLASASHRIQLHAGSSVNLLYQHSMTLKIWKKRVSLSQLLG
jgi:hypothetical protein